MRGHTGEQLPHGLVNRLRTLGCFRLESTAGDVLGPSKPLAVLYALARAPGQSLTRQRLVELLWADAPSERARQSLRQALTQLRGVLGDEAIRATRESVQLRVAVALDLWPLEQALATGDAMAVAHAYPGPLIPEFEGAGTGAFAEWVAAERRALRERVASCFADASRQAAQADRGERVLELEAQWAAVRGRDPELRWPAVPDARPRGEGSDASVGAEAQPDGTAVVGRDSVPGAARRGRAVALATAGTLLVILAVAPFARATLGGQASALLVSTVPIVTDDGTFVPAPVVEIVDRAGRRLNRRVRVRATAVTPEVPMEGTVERWTEGGRATFDDLRMPRGVTVPPDDSLRVRFSSPGLADAVFAIPGRVWGVPSRHALWLEGLRANGSDEPLDRPVRVRAGTPVLLELQTRYSSPWHAASVMLGAWGSWMPREQPVTIGPMVTPALDRPLPIRVALPAPSRPGRHHVVVAFNAEGEVADFFSGTNWTLPGPRWHDDNDIADWTAEQLASARTGGGAWMRYYHEGWTPYRDWIAAVVIDIIVD